MKHVLLVGSLLIVGGCSTLQSLTTRGQQTPALYPTISGPGPDYGNWPLAIGAWVLLTLAAFTVHTLWRRYRENSKNAR